MTSELFPVHYSTLAIAALVEQVLTQYDLPVVTQCQFWKRGMSDVYWVETVQGSFILRVSHAHWRNHSETLFELELLDFLHQRGMPVAHPLRTTTGELAIELLAPEGKRYAALFTYAPGQIPLGDLNETQSHQLGETVARLHIAAADFACAAQRSALDLDYLLDESLLAIAPFLQNQPELHLGLTETVIQLKATLETLPQEAPYWGVCWGDPHSGNSHFTKTDQVTLFDFDQCGYGWRSFDIAKFFQVSLCTGMSYRVRDCFLVGYQSVQPLQELELKHLQSLMQVAHIWRWAVSLNHAKYHDYSCLDYYYFNHRWQQLKMIQSIDFPWFRFLTRNKRELESPHLSSGGSSLS
ncbi:MAG: phosphotransferase [Synechococcales bacterium]|nr:phosphotransferase [Synechococcales bacterium]